MKKTSLIIGISLALFSCKKVNDRKDFEVTDVTGNGILAGKVTKNQLVYNSNGTGFTTIQAPVAGVDVTARINNSDLYPNSSNAQGQKNYFATTDANGDYSMNILSNEDGVQARVVFPEWTGTYDTLLNGVVKTGILNTYYFSYKTTNVWKGMKRQLDFNYSNGPTYGNPGDQQIGTTEFYGYINYQTIRAYTSMSGSLAAVGTTLVPAANVQVHVTWYTDPLTLSAKTYTTTTDLAGRYTVTVTAHTKNNSNFQVFTNDWIHTQDTTVYSNASFTTITTPAKTGRPGFYSNYISGLNGGGISGRIYNFSTNLLGFNPY